MATKLEQARKRVIAALDANEGIVMLGSMAAILGGSWDDTRKVLELLGYEIQDWGGLEYVTDDNSPGVLD